ncbi:MAG: HpcH/HpaI aldolase [Actinomycetia bacterium]|nr:HpcH/HpaI aldolase [Actinomycetes bacterium]
MTNKLSKAWADGGVALGAWVTTNSSEVVEVLSQAGYDYIGIDCQHTLLDESDAGRLLRPLVETPVATIVRVSRNEPAAIGRVLDAGADGVIVPMVDTPEEAAAAVAACRYAPHGVRSFGPHRASLGLEAAVLEERVNCFVMVESAEAIDNLDAICATEGLAGVYVGPGDLSISMGTSWMRTPRPADVVAAFSKVPAACERAGIIPGMHSGNGAFGAELVGLGFRLVTLTSEIGLMRAAAANDLGTARAEAKAT